MTKQMFTKNGTKIQVSYTIDHQAQVYRITEVVEGGESWDAKKIHENRSKIVDAIHYGYSAI